MKRSLSFMIIILLICNVAIANEVGPFWIGIVRIDGILVPIGIYYKNKWINTWPKISDEQSEVDKLAKVINGKMQPQDIPGLWKGSIKKIPTELYLWSKELLPKNLKVINAEKYESHCSVGWGLKTNFQPTKEDNVAPTPKLGIATNYNANVTPFVTINSDSKVDLPLVQAIRAKFDEMEKVNRKISLKDRKDSVVELSHIYKTRHEINGKYFYFIEAQRKYPNPRNAQDASCNDLNVLHSWVILQGDKVSFLTAIFFPTTDCDGIDDKDGHIVPDVVISVEGRDYIVSEDYGYEWESYAIHEILDGNIKEVLRVDGGGC